MTQPDAAAAAPPKTESPIGQSKMNAALDAFRSRPFRFLWISSFNFSLVQGIQRFTFVWLVLDLTTGSKATGLVAFALGIPVFFIALPAGLLSDRMDRRLLLQGSVIGAFVISTVTAVLVLADAITVPLAFVLALGIGTALAFGQPVRQAVLPSIVPRERLMNAIVLMTLGQNVSTVLGPALGGAVIAMGGIGAAFALQAALYGLSFVTLLPLRMPARPEAPPRRNLRAELGEGLAFVAGNSAIRTLVLLLLVGAFFLQGSSGVLIPKIAKEELHRGAFAASMLFGFMGMGMIVSSLFLASQTAMKNKGTWFMAMLVVAGFIYVGMGLSPWYMGLVVLHLLWGITGGFYVNLNQTLIQGHTPLDVMGRVMAVHALVFMGIGPLGSLVAGPAADWMGAREYVVVCGLATVVLTGAALVTQAKLRRLS
ncbi:MAG: MFS transporter [Dehalococcoidia bacterium]